MPRFFTTSVAGLKNVSKIGILAASIILISRSSAGEKGLNFAKNQIISAKQERSAKEDYIKIIELPVKFPIAGPRIKIRLPKWRPEADFDVVEIGRHVLKGIKKRQKNDPRDQPDQLVSELKKGSNERRILSDEEIENCDLNKIIEEFRDFDDQD